MHIFQANPASLSLHKRLCRFPFPHFFYWPVFPVFLALLSGQTPAFACVQDKPLCKAFSSSEIWHFTSFSPRTSGTFVFSSGPLTQLTFSPLVSVHFSPDHPSSTKHLPKKALIRPDFGVFSTFIETYAPNSPRGAVSASFHRFSPDFSRKNSPYPKKHVIYSHWSRSYKPQLEHV